MRPVVLVGAGLAGLACAVTLAKAGVDLVVLEASDAPGGRVRTDRHEGFLLDRGFQVYLGAYPEGARFLDLQSLHLHPFLPGALVRRGGRFRRFIDPWRRPLDSLASWLGNPVSLGDGAAMYRLRGGGGNVPGETAGKLLRRLGFSDELVNHFFRPWFGGVFLDRSLATAASQLQFVFSMMARGDTVLPETGMQALPDQLAALLPPGALRLGARVASLEGTTAVLETGERVEGSALVVAVEGPEAHRLDPALPDPGSLPVTCLYYAAPRSPLTEPILVLNGDEDGPVNNLAVVSDIAPGYAPPGSSLVSVTVLEERGRDEEALRRAVEDQLEGWFGAAVREWRFLRRYRIAHAQPLQTPAALEARRTRPVLAPGRFACGDYLADASINGALASGRQAAEAVLAARAGTVAPA